MRIEMWSIARFVFCARNPRRSDAAVDRMVASIREFGFKVPVLARSDGTVVDGHLRLKGARQLGITEIPVIQAHPGQAGGRRAARETGRGDTAGQRCCRRRS
jgi:hypothetical protein